MKRQLPEPNDGPRHVETGALQIGNDPTGFYLDFIDAEAFANCLKSYLDCQLIRYAPPKEQALYQVISSMEKLIRTSIEKEPDSP